MGTVYICILIYIYIYNFSIWGDLVSLTSMVVGDDPMISPGGEGFFFSEEGMQLLPSSRERSDG